MALHPDELDIDDGVVRRLVDRDLPAFRGEPLRRLASSGSTNALFALGTLHVVRLPRRPGGSAYVDVEARWLPRLGPALPVTVPEIVAVGQPAFGYPERWVVTGWITGDVPPTPSTPGPSADALGRDLAGFVQALRAIDVPVEAATDPRLRHYRGGALTDVDTEIRSHLDDCRRLPELELDLDACAAIWDEAVASPAPAAATDRWVHADLFAENLLVRDGRLAAVLDFGNLAVGDPCVDLAVAWEVLDPHAREVFRNELDVDEQTWLRGRGWALAIALMTFPYYWHTMPERCHARLAMAAQVLADHARSG